MFPILSALASLGSGGYYSLDNGGYRRPQSVNTPEENQAALDKAQEKRDRRAAKRLARMQQQKTEGSE